MNDFEAIVVGGGPAGLSAALTLGRARRRVAILDAGPRRNQAATHVHTFLTRDGTPPSEMRALAHAELDRYPTVVRRDDAVTSITGEPSAFVVETASGPLRASRVLLATGMIDERFAIEGLDALWGSSIVQCPYCHGYEQRDQRFGVIVHVAGMSAMAQLLLNWTPRVTAFVLPGVELAPDVEARLRERGVTIEHGPIARLTARGGRLRGVVVDDAREVACDLLFARPPQRQTPLVASLDLRLDEQGYVALDETHQTSRRGIYAAGDLTSPQQSAIGAAGRGMQTAAMLVHDLSLGH